ncbi:GNAT family N-acetyltransferase [Agromyces cerinus]|uniref:N-acetylglutamate synthase, GNAT family n=1 Tax=Agromyces cerinus subsp. cerinus TaxID=232089 RepID=A0A1N6IA92_9MICO|nr:GNAT family N-acetyltransferase [Agromyces cerinus]SIO28899.1 N-acetylglutamate synthase, GNAT family [Agromyces cerinus subsp. cerinus]
MQFATLEAGDSNFTLRRAQRGDLAALVALIAADSLRAVEETPTAEGLEPYERAFTAIDADAAQTLTVLETVDGRVVGTMQLTLIPGLARRGATRMQIEAVRVSEELRGLGLGSAMIAWAIGHARDQGAALVQLTSDARRADAHRFYERLGFAASHVGFKLFL